MSSYYYICVLMLLYVCPHTVCSLLVEPLRETKKKKKKKASPKWRAEEKAAAAEEEEEEAEEEAEAIARAT